MTAFPEQPLDEAEIFSGLSGLTKDDLRADGRAFAFAYDAGEETRRVARKAFAACMGINGLDPTVYPSARRLETDVVNACLEHLRAPDGAVGSATSCGTESVLLAVKTARDHARRTRPHITEPEMLVPETGHASFHKAAHLFGVKLVPVDVDPDSFRADVADARAKLNGNTVLVVASAPGYAHGVIDPVSELAELAEGAGALCHVDGCIGGWVLPFQRELGVAQPEFDFTVDGVTSISVDLHKYAFAPKGVSILLHRRPELREAQYYACATWSAYSVVNSTLLGSKSLASLGAAWALLRHFGRSGYRDLVGSMWKATEHLCSVISEADELYTLGRPNMGLVAVACRKGDPFVLADRLTERGWHVQPTYAYSRSPAHVHLTLDPGNSARVEDFARDLVDCARNLPAPEAPPEQVVQMLSQVARSDDPDTESLFAQFGIADGQLPGARAELDRIMNALPPDAREALLVKFMSALFR